jgi:hypothetical protein
VLRLRAFAKISLILLAVLAVVSVIFVWRGSSRHDDYWSCKIQAQDRETIGAAHRSIEASPDQLSAQENVFLDECMRMQGHSFTGGSDISRCARARDGWCYSVF